MKTEDLNSDNDRFLAQWLAGELTDDTLKHLVSKADFQSFLKLRKGIEAYDYLESSTEPTFKNVQAHIQNRQAKSKVRRLYPNAWLLGIAAAILLLFGLFIFNEDSMVRYETGFGEQKTIALLDGSEVTLNSRSILTYDEENWADQRTLFLEGEAYFKVKPGQTFTVSTEGGIVQVLGTQFNVKSTYNFLEVVCYEGKVSVTINADSTVLLPSHSLRQIKEKPFETWQTETTGPTWVFGESSFKSVPIGYVISAIEAQYGISIKYDTIDEHVIYTGSFTHSNLNLALKTVFKSLDIIYNEKEKGIIYLSQK